MNRVLLALALAALASRGIGAEGAENGVVDLEAQAPAGEETPGWTELEPTLKGGSAQEALNAYLKNHPKGPAAARALLERGRRAENLEEAARDFKRAWSEDPSGRWGQAAALEQAKMDYALGRAESALMALSSAREELLEGEEKAQLVYWRAQARMVLKGFTRAQVDFEAFLRNFPEHPLADQAALGLADCDAAQKHDEAALQGYQKLYADPPSSVAPQAMWQAAGLLNRGGKVKEAGELYARLSARWPESLESSRAKEALKALPAPQPSPTPALRKKNPAWTVQVGAYARRVGADKLVAKLKSRRYPVRLDKRVIEENVLHLVQVGRYANKAAANAMAVKLQKREKVPTRVVEIQD